MFVVTQNYDIIEINQDHYFAYSKERAIFNSYGRCVEYCKTDIGERLMEIDATRQALLDEQKLLKTKLDNYASTS